MELGIYIDWNSTPGNLKFYVNQTKGLWGYGPPNFAVFDRNGCGCLFLDSCVPKDTGPIFTKWCDLKGNATKISNLPLFYGFTVR